MAGGYNARTTLGAIYGGAPAAASQSIGQTPQVGGINQSVSPMAGNPSEGTVKSTGSTGNAPAFSWLGIVAVLLALGFLSAKANGS